MRGTGFAARALGATMASAALVASFAAPASAAARPPTADFRLAGTWVNTNAATRNVKQINISRDGLGGINVNAFGACSPTLCEWGQVPALLYGVNVSSTTGAKFQTNQRFLSGATEWSRTVLQGSLQMGVAGPRLSVRSMTTFTDASGRRNYTVSETFVPGKGQATTRKGFPVADYPLGAPPAPFAGLFGTWKNVAASPALHSVVISPGSPTVPLVRAFGSCSPTPCDLGVVRGVTYGTAISSVRGETVLAPYSFGFKKEQLVMRYVRLADGSERLIVDNYNEFTDGSGRSNYHIAEMLVRA